MTLYTLLFLCTPAYAQVDIGMGLDPSMYSPNAESSGPVKITDEPYAKVLADYLLASKSTDYWQTLAISSAAPARDLSLVLRRGFGRNELLTLLIIAEAGRLRLDELTKRRVKGARLRELSVEQSLDYTQLRSDVEKVKAELVRKMPVKISENQDDGKTRSGTAADRKKPKE